MIGNPPAPAELEYTLTTAGDGVVTKPGGSATVHGTVACNADTTVHLTGHITQVKNKNVTIQGTLLAEVDCVAGETGQWSATAVPSGTKQFEKGAAAVTGTAWAIDPNYPSNTVWVDLVPTTVTLDKAPPGNGPKPPKGEAPQPPKPKQP